jgi:hypothetical protein
MVSHVRNLDATPCVAVLVGLVALVTDGFLQLVVEAGGTAVRGAATTKGSGRAARDSWSGFC